MVEMRQKLFLSYSSRDDKWFKLFMRHLAEQFRVRKEVWVDVQSIEGGAKWEESIRKGAACAKCALVLLTPRYLDCERYARKELDLLLEEARNGLRLLPVLVEPCSWHTIEGLQEINLMRWTGSSEVGTDIEVKRDRVVPLSATKDGDPRSSAVIDICKQVKANMGVAGASTPAEQDSLREKTAKILKGVEIYEPVHTGHFSVVFRGKLGNETVAVKAVPAEARQDQVRSLYDAALKAARELSDPAFINVRLYQLDTEPHCLVMDYMDDKEWPTLEHKLAEYPGRRLPPLCVARVLSTIARAQAVAHRSNLQLGPLSSANIYVKERQEINERWEIKISPFRIEGQLGLAAELEEGQILRWDIISSIIPEVWDGRYLLSYDYDRAEQYYLGLLGLELLLGYKPIEIRCFGHLERKRLFFDDPRGFFVDADADRRPWTEEYPALAFVMGRLLTRKPDGRYETAEEASRELDAVAKEILPESVLKEVNKDYETLVEGEFGERFYDRLFLKREKLRELFRDVNGQHKMLVDALLDLMAFNLKMKHGRFQRIADDHKGRGISPPDVDAFRCAFLEQIEEYFPENPAKRDAWHAVLKPGLEIIIQRL